MTQIRENVYQLTHGELGRPTEKGWVEVPGGGKLLVDDADVRFFTVMSGRGYEPTIFISRSPVMGGEYVVVARQWSDES